MTGWYKSTPKSDAESPRSDRDILEQLAYESLREQRRARRWSIFFKAFFAIYLVVILYLFFDDGIAPISETHTALIQLEGVIADDGDIDADRIVGGLRAAFEAESAKGVILRINSPGGSPVQSRYINAEITRLRQKYTDKPIFAVVSDVCASGGYYVAVAADRIYASQASIVGSIGVLTNGFGFVETMKKLGVERRLMTSGKYKGMLDPFSPRDPVAEGHHQEILDQIHEQFIDAVKDGRGDRLVDNEDIFSGLFWTGEQAKKLGLVDDFGSASYVAREVIGQEKIVDYTPKANILDRVAERIGLAVAKTLGTETIVQYLKLR
jgi:protease-4